MKLANGRDARDSQGMFVDSMRMNNQNTHMKRRVNLTLDAKLVLRAKALALQQGSSVSQLVEKGLQDLAKDFDIQAKRFSDKWMGKLHLAPRNPADPRQELLFRKYKLTENADSHRH
jgi:hypothetical protein